MDGPESWYQVSVKVMSLCIIFKRTYEGTDGFTALALSVRYVPLITLRVPIRETLARYVFLLSRNLRDILPK